MTFPTRTPFSGAFFMASSNSTQTRAFLWQNGKKRDLGTLGGPDATPFPGAINERGQIAGMSYTNSTPGPPSGLPPLNPFLWNKGRMIDLGSLGGNFGLAIALNEHGQVVGFSDLYGDAL